jgi:nicotinamidase-related amidase
MKKTLVVMDYINEIIHPDGKFKGKGYAAFAVENKTLENVAEAVNVAREKGISIVYVKTGFSDDYKEQPKNSPLFGKADQFQALKLGTWATEFHKSLDIQPQDLVVVKHRVSPFYGTSLDSFLRNDGTQQVYLAGVATDLVVQAAARDAHDRDYGVFVLSDCCAAGSMEDHNSSLKTLSKIATVGNYKELL